MSEMTPAIMLAEMPGWSIDLGLSILMFATVFLFVRGLLGHPGKVTVSPQREAALATGHTDRRTLFEKPISRTLMWPLLALAHGLSAPRLKDRLRATLVSAGSPEYYTAEEYLAVAMFNGILAGVVLVVTWMLLAEGVISLFCFALGFAGGFILTIIQIKDKAGKRLRLISKQIPYSLDLIALAMGAGATFTEAVQTVIREKTEDPFNVELKALLAEMDLGTTRRKALENMSERVPLDPLRSIISSVIQAEELGTPLSEVLHSQANLLRLHRSTYAENAAAVASIRILVPSLLILMAVILALFAPMILKGVRGGLY
jgi:tight adherence protein C